MAKPINRSRICVTVKNVKSKTRYFSHDQLEAVEAYVQELRGQKYKPNVKQLDDCWLARIRTKGQKEQTATFSSEKEAEHFIKHVEAERERGLFVDLTLPPLPPKTGSLAE
ncbi:MAG TPA: hypothetical protein VGE36_07355 [Roseateles sp.]